MKMIKTWTQRIAKEQEAYFIKTSKKILENILPDKGLVQAEGGQFFRYYYDAASLKTGDDLTIELKYDQIKKGIVVEAYNETSKEYEPSIQLSLDEKSLKKAFDKLFFEENIFLRHLSHFTEVHKYSVSMYEELKKVNPPSLKVGEKFNWNYELPKQNISIYLTKELKYSGGSKKQDLPSYYIKISNPNDEHKYTFQWWVNTEGCILEANNIIFGRQNKKVLEMSKD
ncbi:hypothetical protein HYT26_04290 [Candidatus Pacearchaeota archaeon]|nr:hypothetical protein [Candidatus Pacearchaeota archaeon]